MGHDHDHSGDAHGEHRAAPHHGHGAGPGHGHGMGSSKQGAAFAIGIALNLGFVVTETAYGILSHSMALVADAGHNLSDVLGLGLAWGASILARRVPTKRRTYGFRSTTILASLINAVVLLVAVGAIGWESVRRLAAPEPVAEATVIVVAIVGVVINGVSALLFVSGSKGDLNLRSAFVHLASDAVLSLGVAVAGGVMLFTGWRWLDPVVSIGLSIAILVGTWSLMKSSVNLILNAVPEGIEPDEVRSYLASLPGALEVHDLHIWAMSTSENALTAHLVMKEGTQEPRFLPDVCKVLHDRFGIEHCTLQLEQLGAPDPCRLAPEDTV